MADFNADRGMKRKKKPPGLAPAATAPKLSSQPDGQNSVGTGSNGVSESLEIGSQFRLDLRNEDLLVLKELGHGNGGTVSKVQHVVTKNIMAKKVIKVEPKDRKQIVRELQVMHNCNSPYIISFYGAFMVDGRDDVVMCLEYMDCGSLDWISKDFGPIRVDILGKIAEAVLGGLSYLYSAHKIMHRDIKPSNVVLNSKGEIKLCDFGVSGLLINSVAATFTGTSLYMAPERITNAGAYTVRSDVWSVGLMLLELAIGESPFRDDGDDDDDEGGGGGTNEPMPILALLQRIVFEPAPKLPESDAFPQILDDMIDKCLIKDPEQRPTPQDLLDTDLFIQAAKRTPVDVQAWAVEMMEKKNGATRLSPEMSPASRDALRTTGNTAANPDQVSSSDPAAQSDSTHASSSLQTQQPTPPPSSREPRATPLAGISTRPTPGSGNPLHINPKPPIVSTHNVPSSTAAYDYGAPQSAVNTSMARPLPPRTSSSTNIRSTPLTTHPSEFRSAPFTTHRDEPSVPVARQVPDYATDTRQHPAFQTRTRDNERKQRDGSTARGNPSANSDSLPLQHLDSASSVTRSEGMPLPTPPVSARSRPGGNSYGHRGADDDEMVRGAARLNLNGDQSDWQHY